MKNEAGTRISSSSWCMICLGSAKLIGREHYLALSRGIVAGSCCVRLGAVAGETTAHFQAVTASDGEVMATLGKPVLIGGNIFSRRVAAVTDWIVSFSRTGQGPGFSISNDEPA